MLRKSCFLFVYVTLLCSALYHPQWYTVDAQTITVPPTIPTTVPPTIPTTVPTTVPPTIPQPTPTSAPPSTIPPSPTAIPTPDPTPVQPPPSGDLYEPDDTCPTAREILPNGLAQTHTFHRNPPENIQGNTPANTPDIDWVYFHAPHDGSYQILVDVPAGSPADIDLVYYSSCSSAALAEFNHPFTAGVRLTVRAVAGETFYLALSNMDPSIAGPHVRYHLSVDALPEEQTVGAVIIVAGRLRNNDPVQPNINNSAQAMAHLFQAKGVRPDDIYLLATDPSLSGYSDAATVDNLRKAITEWAAQRVSATKGLTLYMISHGVREELYLDKINDEVLTSGMLDEWLTTLETAVSGLKSNIILEACHSGSFIDMPINISHPERVVISSADADYDAHTSREGAYFTDSLIIKLGQNYNLAEAFDAATGVVDILFPSQNPWLDADGDGIHNEDEDRAIAATRRFHAPDTEPNNWPPLIAAAHPPDIIVNQRGRLRANVLDDHGVADVWAVIYPPDYSIPPVDGEFNIQEQDIVRLQQTAGTRIDGNYAGEYDGFSQTGVYRIIIHAQDDEGLQAQPVVVDVTVTDVSYQMFLPTVSR
ncbi:MAG: hypothetical protein AAF639_25560 [Chloroflexota bacterium]